MSIFAFMNASSKFAYALKISALIPINTLDSTFFYFFWTQFWTQTFITSLKNREHILYSIFNCTVPEYRHILFINRASDLFLDALASLKTMLDIQSVSDVFKISRLQSIREYYRVLQSTTEYYRVLQSVTECYRVLKSITECNRVLQSVTECYRVLQSVTECYRV